MSNADIADTQNTQTAKEGEVMPSQNSSQYQQGTTSTSLQVEGKEMTKDDIMPQNEVVLKHLAMQLEYYFSKQNLATDTYVQTLRELNDGCVPVRILANFSKVKTITSVDPAALFNEDVRINAILHAVRNGYTNLLEVHSIDKATGKIVPSSNEEATTSKTIIAIGPVTKQPLEKVTLTGSQVFYPKIVSTTSSTSNTIILREVSPTVTEHEVLTLFTGIPDCPPVIEVVRDVANCWFIILDTNERTVMMNIMMQVRSMTLGGEYVLARLKASSTNLSTVDVYRPVVVQTNPLEVMQSSQGSSSESRKQKKKARPKHNRNRRNSFPTSPSNSRKVKSSPNKVETPHPPSLTVDHFPSLNNEKKVEWETSPDDGSHNCKGMDDDKSEESGESPKSTKGFSDGSSTATTTSSSMESLPKKVVPIGGYAAALLKPVTTTKSSTAQKSCTSEVSKDSENDTIVCVQVKEEKKVENLPPPSASIWGQRRSFADVLKEEKVKV